MGSFRAPLLALTTLVGCGDHVFQCMDDPQCDGGYCEASGYCSFDDADCDSGRRYGPLAGGGLGGKCVAPEDTSTSIDATSSTDPFTTTGLTSATTSTTRGDTSTEPDPVTTTPISSGPDTESTTDAPLDTGDVESSGTPSETTGTPLEISVSFGDRADADFQDVVEDTSLLNYATGDNMGIHGDLHLDGNDFGAWQVGLMRFDVSALPDDATIVGATLQLWTFELADPGEVEIHALTEPWLEGEQDQMLGVANWFDRLEGTPWTTEGAGDGTYDPTPLAVFAFDTPSTQYDLALPPELIDVWRNGAQQNFGLLMHSVALAQPLYIPSSESPDEFLRPLLVVTYVP